MVATVDLAGFTAYTSITSFIHAAAGIIGLTLPFGAYTFATSALFFMSNPIVAGGIAIVGGRFAIKRANRQMRDRLVPVMVASAVIAATDANAQTMRPAIIAKRLATALSDQTTADPRLRARIERTFPDLPKLT
jgi:hypothetical protein